MGLGHFSSEEEIEARRKKLHEGLAEKVKIHDKRKKELSPAEKGFEAARHDNDTKQIYHQETNTFEAVPVDKKKEKMLETLKDENLGKVDVKLQKVVDMLNEQQKKLEALLTKREERINEEKEKYPKQEGALYNNEFVEDIETENSGGNMMLDKIRFKHTDVVIIIGIDSISVFESMQDFEDSTEPLFDLVLEEMEKVDISDIPERKKTGIEKLDALIETYDQINADAEPGDTVMELKAKNYDYYVEELNAHNYDEEQKNLFLGWLSKQK